MTGRTEIVAVALSASPAALLTRTHTLVVVVSREVVRRLVAAPAIGRLESPKAIPPLPKGDGSLA